MTEQKENSLSEKLNNTKKRLNDLSKKVADNTKSFIQTTNNSIKTSLNERKEKREEKKQEKLNQAKKEISEAKKAVRSFSTRISEQYGVLNVTKRIERKLRSIEWPRTEERSEDDYTKDNPGPGSYDPIIESKLPQQSQKFLKKEL